MSTRLFISATSTFRAVITSASGQRWDNAGEALEAHDDPSWSDYLITPTQQGTSTQWYVTVPASLPAGDYLLEVFDGSNPSVTAQSFNAPLGFAWDGSALILTTTVEDKIASAQEIARLTHAHGTVWYVSTDGDDGDDGLSPSTAKLTAKTVIEAASAGDLVILGPGEHAVDAGEVIAVPSGVEVRGTGLDLTIISGSKGISGGPLVTLTSDVTLTDLTVIDSHDNGAAVGRISSTDAFERARMLRVRGVGAFDGFRFDGGAAAASIRMEDCVAETQYDGVSFWSFEALTAELINVRSHSAGGLGGGALRATALYTSSLGGSSRIVVVGGRYTADQPSGTSPRGAIITGTSSARVDFIGTQLAATGGASPLALTQSSVAVAISSCNLIPNSTGGTITVVDTPSVTDIKETTDALFTARAFTVGAGATTSSVPITATALNTLDVYTRKFAQFNGDGVLFDYTVRVSGFTSTNSTTGTLTFSPPLPAAPEEGDPGFLIGRG